MAKADAKLGLGFMGMLLLGLGLGGCAPARVETFLLPNPVSLGPEGELALVLMGGDYFSMRSCSRLQFWIAEGQECRGGALVLLRPGSERPEALIEDVLWARFTSEGLLAARAEGWKRTGLVLLRPVLKREQELLQVPGFVSWAELEGRWLTYQEAPTLSFDFVHLFGDLGRLARQQVAKPEDLRFLQELFTAAKPLWAFDLQTHQKAELLERVVAHRWAAGKLFALVVQGELLQTQSAPVRAQLVRLEPGAGARELLAEWSAEPEALLYYSSLSPGAFLEVSPDGQEAFVVVPDNLYRVDLASTPARVEELRRGAFYPALAPSGRRLAFADFEHGGVHVWEGRETQQVAEVTGLPLFWLSERELGFAAASALTATSAGEKTPAQSPGIKVEIRLDEDQPQELWVVDLESGQRRPLLLRVGP